MASKEAQAIVDKALEALEDVSPLFTIIQDAIVEKSKDFSDLAFRLAALSALSEKAAQLNYKNLGDDSGEEFDIALMREMLGEYVIITETNVDLKTKKRSKPLKEH